MYGHPEAVKALLEKGADRSIENKFGKTAAHETTIGMMLKGSDVDAVQSKIKRLFQNQGFKF